MKSTKIATLFICFFVFVNMSFSQLFPVSKMGADEEWTMGYINNLGKLYAPYEYQSTYDFSDSLGKVGKYINEELKYGFLNKFGRVEVPLIYEEAQSFKNGYAFVTKGGKNFIIDKKAKEYQVDNLVFNARNFVSEGLVCIQVDGKKGYADLNNKIHIPAELDVATPFSEGFAIGIKDKKIIIIDRNGKQTNTEYIDAIKFKNGVCSVKNANGKWGVINSKLEPVVDFKYNYIDEFNSGIAPFEGENSKWGLINEKGEIVLAATYLDVSLFSEGRFFAKNDDGSISLCNESFKEIKKFDKFHEFSSSYTFKNGICSMSKIVTDKTNKDENIRNYGGMANFFINKNGEIIWQSETYYSCFPEDSPVKMADLSSKNIQDVQVGDEVLTYNDVTKKNELSKVLKLEIHEGQFDLLEVSVSQIQNLTCSLHESESLIVQKLSATPNHPVLTNSGVKLMCELNVNDFLFVWNEELQKMDELKIESIKVLEKTDKVYNLKTVAGNYIVNSVVVMMK